MQNVGANQSVGYITSVPHIPAMWQEFLHPKVAVCCVTIDWATIESTSGYQVQKWITFCSSLQRFFSSQDDSQVSVYRKKSETKPAMDEIKRKKIVFKCSQTTAEGRASPAEKLQI